MSHLGEIRPRDLSDTPDRGKDETPSPERIIILDPENLPTLHLSLQIYV